MGKGIGQYDGPILGALAGLLVAYPSWATKVNELVAKLPQVPQFETYSTLIWSVGIGVIIGFIIEKSK